MVLAVRWMNVGLQSLAAAAALEGNDQPGTLVAEPCMYRALCGLAGLQWPKNLHQATDEKETQA